VPEKLEACAWALVASGIRLKIIAFAVALTGVAIIRASKAVAYAEEL
jgi:hypothetical protein